MTITSGSRQKCHAASFLTCANSSSKGMKSGLQCGKKAIDLFLSQMNKGGIIVKVREVGLLLPREKPYLGATLDRLVTFLDTNEKWGMEMKSPFSKAGITVGDACKSKNLFLELADASIQLYIV